MSKIGFDTFAFVINFIDDDWIFFHVTMGRFEVLNTFGSTLTKQLKLFLATYQLLNQMITYNKDEGINLNMFVLALTNVVSCEFLQLFSTFKGTYFGHVMLKACH